MTVDEIVEAYAKAHKEIGDRFIQNKISYENYIKFTNRCALFADRLVLRLNGELYGDLPWWDRPGESVMD